MSTPANAAVVLRVETLGKEYKLYDSPRQRLKALLTGRAMHHSHWALQDVSFQLLRGQCIGVVGDNGAGKSSLLKLLAGTLQPSVGRVERSGRVTAILELGAGFHPDFSGRDNLYFGGSLIGIEREEMKRLEPEIAEFCELGDALDRPVKTYSSGMTVRLAFALVTAVQPDLLIVDEALAVGDQHFQKKCVDRIARFRANGCTILFCSHSLYHVRQLCDLSLWLDHGKVKAFGDTDSVLASYGVHVRAQDAPTAVTIAPVAVEMVDPPQGVSGKRAEIISVCVQHLDEQSPPLLRSKSLVVEVVVRMHQDEIPSIGIMLEQAQGVGITSVATHVDGTTPVQISSGRWRSILSFPDLPLHSSDYVLSAYLFDAQGLVVYEEWLRCVEFRWEAPSLLPGLVHLPHHWG